MMGGGVLLQPESGRKDTAGSHMLPALTPSSAGARETSGVGENCNPASLSKRYLGYKKEG